MMRFLIELDLASLAVGPLLGQQHTGAASLSQWSPRPSGTFQRVTLDTVCTRGRLGGVGTWARAVEVLQPKARLSLGGGRLPGMRLPC